MPASEAKILANRANSARSTGPKTPEGKERSRRNGLKHGMTGQGIVIPEGDAAEVESRNAALQAELAPKSVMGAILVGQMATLSIRMERGAAQEFARVAERVRHAAEDFDAERVERAEHLLETIGDDPRGNLKQLLKSPEGVDVLVETWQGLRANLTREPSAPWPAARTASMANLLGFRVEEPRASRLLALLRATWGNFEALDARDGAGLERDDRMAWAHARMLEWIDGELAGLAAHRESLDFEMIEQDRDGAGARALFDPSKEASLARRYESEARRGFFRSLKEFRHVEAEAAEQVAPAPPAIAIPSHAPLASSCEEPSTDPDVLIYDPIGQTPTAPRRSPMGVSGEIEPSRSVDSSRCRPDTKSRDSIPIPG